MKTNRLNMKIIIVIFVLFFINPVFSQAHKDNPKNTIPTNPTKFDKKISAGVGLSILGLMSNFEIKTHEKFHTIKL